MLCISIIYIWCLVYKQTVKKVLIRSASVGKGTIHKRADYADNREANFNGIFDDTKMMSALVINLSCEGQTVELVIDTGAASTVADLSFYNQYLNHCKLTISKQILRGASGTKLTIIGECVVQVNFNGKEFHLPIVIINNSLDKHLLGRTWLARFWPEWKINIIQTRKLSSQDILQTINVSETDMFQK